MPDRLEKALFDSKVFERALEHSVIDIVRALWYAALTGGPRGTALVDRLIDSGLNPEDEEKFQAAMSTLSHENILLLTRSHVNDYGLYNMSAGYPERFKYLTLSVLLSVLLIKFVEA